MPGRRLIEEDSVLAQRTTRMQARRRAVLRETLEAFEREGRDHYLALAEANVARWAESRDPLPVAIAHVFGGDWGEVTLDLTRRYGAKFAVLNMANAYVPGGAYVEGAAAQEENMFRRTDCHFTITDEEMEPRTERYRPELTRLLSAADGRVLLDLSRPRVCIRGPERREEVDRGYAFLADDEVFPFYELRGAAQDCRAKNFDPDEARRRIEAQLDTLVDAGIERAVLSAFGCGAFQNPARKVAPMYLEALKAREGRFECIAFAIYGAGYSPNNEPPFREVFEARPSR